MHVISVYLNAEVKGDRIYILDRIGGTYKFKKTMANVEQLVQSLNQRYKDFQAKKAKASGAKRKSIKNDFDVTMPLSAIRGLVQDFICIDTSSDEDETLKPPTLSTVVDLRTKVPEKENVDPKTFVFPKVNQETYVISPIKGARKVIRPEVTGMACSTRILSAPKKPVKIDPKPAGASKLPRPTFR